MLRTARVLLLGVLALPAFTGVALGCEVCYGSAEGSTLDAARLGTFFLLGIVVLLQAAFAAFFLYLRRAARRAASEAIDREWSRLSGDHASGIGA